jgi:hypothetical protein
MDKFPSSRARKVLSSLLRPLEKANLHHSNEQTRADVFLTLTEDEGSDIFRNVVSPNV